MRTALGWGCAGLTLRVQQAGQTQVLLGCAEGSLQVVVGVGLGEFTEVHEIRPVQGIEGEGSRQAPVPGEQVTRFHPSPTRVRTEGWQAPGESWGGGGGTAAH